MNGEVSVFLKSGKEIILNDFVNISFFYNGAVKEVTNFSTWIALPDETLKFNCKSYSLLIAKNEISYIKIPSSLFSDD